MASSPTIRRGVRGGSRAPSASISARVAATRSLTSSTSTACSKGSAVLVQQRFEPHGQRAGTSRLGRRPPLAPLVDAVVEKQPFDDRRQVRTQAAPLAEPPQDLIVVVDQFQSDVRGEFLGLRHAQAMPAHDETDHALDEGELRLKQVGGVDRQWVSRCEGVGNVARFCGQPTRQVKANHVVDVPESARRLHFSVQLGRFPCRCAINTVHPWRAVLRSRRFIPLLPRVSGV